MPDRRYRILHCLRAPVGGLFRHVRDLAREQARLGHDVGVICDVNAKDPLAEEQLGQLSTSLALGLHRTAMSRDIGFIDFSACRAVRRIAARAEVDVIHGHGAKGGAYARYAAYALRRGPRRIVVFYTPHGGSLHYDPATVKGRAIMAIERRLQGMTNGLIFESQYAADSFAEKVGQPVCASRTIHNGILPAELEPVQNNVDAAEFLFIGELRLLKGVDLMLEALARLRAEQPVRAVIVGSGPDAAKFQQQAAQLGLSNSVKFAGAMSARAAFPLGRILVIPSRAESLPYIALEGAGAGKPLIATHVGGLPEIVAGTDTALVAPGDVDALADAMRRAIASEIRAVDSAERLRRAVAGRFTVANMTREVLAFYGDALGVATLEQMASAI